MNPWISIFNIVAPFVFQEIRNAMDSNPDASYRENLEKAGIKLDVEHAQLLADMAQAVKDGAVPRIPPQ